MKIGIFVPTLKKDYNKASSAIWIRAYEMAKYFRIFGIDVSINNIFKTYDISIFYRGMDKKSVYFINFLKKISKKVYWDTCVNYYVIHEASSLEQVENAITISKCVDGVLCTTSRIEAFAKKYNSQIFVYPDPISLEHYRYKKIKINFENPIFIWSGISNKAVFLNQYLKLLDDNIIIISDSKPKVLFKYDFYSWRYESFPLLINLGDIAFLPRLLDTSEYNMGHSSYKALVFAIQGIPIIANKIPAYMELAEYYDAIVFLEDFLTVEEALEELKSRDRSVDLVREEYSYEKWSIKLLNFLKKEFEK